MKNGTMMAIAMVALFNLGLAQAEPLKPRPGFDRVGMVSADNPQLAGERRHSADGARFKLAPGEGATESNTTRLAERKREMARRLVWMMLSAR